MKARLDHAAVPTVGAVALLARSFRGHLDMRTSPIEKYCKKAFKHTASSVGLRPQESEYSNLKGLVDFLTNKPGDLPIILLCSSMNIS